MDEYTAWDKVPENLKTKTQLKETGLRPAPDQDAAAQFCSYIRGKSRPTYYDLYDSNQAQTRPKATPAQLAALQKARAEWERRRTCQRCGLMSNKPLRHWPHCRWCSDHLTAVEWAKTVLNDPQAIILDTETTDLNGEPVEISIINVTGETLLNTLVKATKPIDPDAQAVHGITEADLQTAPSFPDVYPELCRILEAAPRIIIYNASFDFGVLERARTIHTLPPFSVALFDDIWPEDVRWWRGLACAMKWYAQWYGEWSNYHKSYKWQRLDGGHRALGDCLATLAAIKEMTHERKEP
jgi:DNA polymerase-3 subunit epsilon